MADDFSELKSLAELAVEYLDLLNTTTRELTDSQKEAVEYLNLLVDTVKDNTDANKDNTNSTKKNTDATEDSTTAFKDLKKNSINLGKELLNIANAGVKFATSIGTTATRGVEMEIKNRAAVASQLFNFNANLAVTIEQLKQAQTGFSDVFVGAAEGMQISAEGSREFVKSLKAGFKSEFEPTAETFRMLTQMGMSTTSQFEAFRKATGRASLSNNQLATLYNKNTLSFLLYGSSFARAAVQAEKLGVNLASVQAAQEGLVTNLDGTIDTVAQLNQLGAGIDFGSLVRIAEQEGPDALMAYVRATVPANLMQSASTRALFKQLGISVEDYMKSGDAQISAAENMERKMTEAATETGKTTKVLGALGAIASKISSVLMGSFGAVAIAGYAAAASLLKLAATGALGAGAQSLAGAGMTALKVGASGAAGVGIGTALGTAMGGSTTGSIIGSVLGTTLGAMLIPILGPLGPALGGMLGGTVGGFVTKPKTAEDMMSGYGKRMLLTPDGPIALNNKDTVIAGTNLFKGDDVTFSPAGSLSLANMGLNVAQTGAAAAEKGAINQFVKKNLPYLASFGKLGGKGIDLTRTVDTFFGTIGKNSSLMTKYLGKNLQAIPLIGSILGGIVSGAMEYNESGSLMRALGMGSFSALGGIGGSMLGAFATGGNPIAASLGGIGGSMGAEWLFNKMFGSSYGQRSLVTPKGAFALNKADDIVAGTNLFPKGAVKMGSDNTDLLRKIDTLIAAISNANTTINVGGSVQTVPRIQLVGVHSRNEVR